MGKIDTPLRHELREASDDVIEDAVKYADPMVLRGLLYQLTGDPEIAATSVKTEMIVFYEVAAPGSDADVTFLRRKAADFLKAYRDAGAGPITSGPPERLPVSLSLIAGEEIPAEDIGLYIEELALNPWGRSLNWTSKPDAKRLQDFTVTIIGAGMGGLNAALQLRRAGISCAVIEKNADVGGTWHENRYPGARVDTPSRSYTHMFGIDFGYPNPYCAWDENQKYFNWVADAFDLRDLITFNTEVRSLTWDEKTATWEIRMDGPDGARTMHSNAVITAVGFLNRPFTPDLEGAKDFQGPSWHTSRWPKDYDWRGKRIGVIGTGATGYQMVPELALQAKHVTVFQRTAQWVAATPGYRSPFPPQINWLDRNLPFHTNFMRFRSSYGASFRKIGEIDPHFSDPYSCSPGNKRARDACVAFLERKLGDAKLVAAMTPPHPVWSARAIAVDPEYSILDAIKRDNVTLVTAGIAQINRTGIKAQDGTQHDVDVIVYATGFHPNEYLFPMTITGRDGKAIEELWADGGARAFKGCMMPGFPNLWSIYGPNTNGSLNVACFHELITLYALQCMERLILDGKQSIEVKEDVFWRYNRMLDERNKRMVWSDPRAHNYYWNTQGRSAVMSPFTGPEMWRFLRHPDPADFNVQ